MKKKFLHFQVPADLLKKIDEIRFQMRFPSRVACITWLLQKALKKS